MKMIRALLLLCLLLFLNACGGNQTSQPEPELQSNLEREQTTTESKPQSEAPPSAETDKPTANDESMKPSEPVAAPEPPSTPTPAAPTPTVAEPKQTPSVQPTERASSKPAAPTPASPPVEEKKAVTVQLSIRGDQQVGVILAPTDVTYMEGDTPLSALARTLKEKQIPLDYTGSGRTAYVKGIANLYEFDRGPLSGWLYRVNGAFHSESAGSFKLQPGDQVEWLYTLDLGKDIGATP